MRRAFTLIEMMVSVTLLSVIILFLYQSLNTLQQGNHKYADFLDDAEFDNKIIKTLFLDLTLSEPSGFKTIAQNRQYDDLFMKTRHSAYNRVLPFVSYRIKEGRLYRIESSEPLNTGTSAEQDMLVDDLGAFESFRVYKNSNDAVVHLKAPLKRQKVFKVHLYNH